MILLDLGFLATKKEQYKAVYKSMEIMGWYSSGENLTPEIDAAIHKQIMEHNENPLYLFFSSPSKRGNEGAVSLSRKRVDMMSLTKVCNDRDFLSSLSTAVDVTSSDLPIQLFESEWHVVDNVPTMSFSPVSYTVEVRE